MESYRVRVTQFLKRLGEEDGFGSVFQDVELPIPPFRD